MPFWMKCGTRFNCASHSSILFTFTDFFIRAVRFRINSNISFMIHPRLYFVNCLFIRICFIALCNLCMSGNSSVEPMFMFLGNRKLKWIFLKLSLVVSSRLSHRWQAAVVGTVDQSSRQITVWFWAKKSIESSNSAPMSLTSLTVSYADAISAKSTTNFPQQSSLISLKRLANCTKLAQWRLYTSCVNTSG